MISRDAAPIAHIPPRAPIELRPTWPARPEPYKNCWELAAEEEEARRKAKRDEEMWQAVCDVASARGGLPAPKPVSEPEPAETETAVYFFQDHRVWVNTGLETVEFSQTSDITEWQWKPEFAQSEEASPAVMACVETNEWKRGLARAAVHSPDCDWHTDQYPWECNCGGMSNGGRELVCSCC